MQNSITPEQVEQAAVKARLPLTAFIRQAGIAPSVFYRWKSGKTEIRPLSLAKLADLVDGQ